ncbi:hypothetical protein FJT64_027002 [Amphibalanus amphitrite]|uniref:Retrotransposon gag domain-containing protein n=1 Tax=Amphibalanus amphitrite TaxID=1232801 RepID=A0A6A4WCA7_AMPAM|nr:hypothetical protein FJT64_027002 [Amphibalanus amphitrite]
MVSSKKTGHSVDSPMGRSSEWMERLNSYFTSVGPDVARSLAAADTGEPLPPRPPRVCSGAFAPQPATLPELSTALGRMGTSPITSRAFDFVMRLSDDDRNSWRRLCEKLKAEFDAPGLTVQYALEFHQRIRAPGESLATFLYDLETLCARAYPEWEDTTYRQRLVKDRFLMGIGDKSRKHILSFYQPTWSTEEVLLEARKLEQIETSAGGGAAVGAVHGPPKGDQSDNWSTGSRPNPSDTSALSALTSRIQMMEEQMQACRYVDPPAVRASTLSGLSQAEREARDRRLKDTVHSKVAEADVTDEQRRALAAVLLQRSDAFSVQGEVGMCDLWLTYERM